MTSYLPSSLLYLNEYRNERKYICDKLLSIEFGQLLLNTSNINKKQGYPFDKVCHYKLTTPNNYQYINFVLRYENGLQRLLQV